MKKYEKYKDSGIEWLGEIPEHWENKKAKYLLNEENGIKIGPFGSALKLDTLVESGIKIYGQGNVIKDDFTLGERYLTIKRFDSDFKQYEIIDGDILITMMGTTGKSKVFSNSFEKGILDSHLLRLRFNENKFSGKLFSVILEQSHYIIQQIDIESKGSIMAGLNSSIVKKLSIIVPPLLEQTTIASFLDHKTTQIDTLIEKKELLIEKLKLQRQAIINEAVTKGLNPDAPLKDSGIEWLGEIPEHWEVSKIKHHIRFLSGFPFKSEDYSEEGIKLARGMNVKEGAFDWSDVRFWSQIEEYLEQYVLQEGDVLIGMDGSKVGKNFCKVRESDLPVLLLQRVARLRALPSVLSDFIYWNIGNARFYHWVQISKTDPMIPHIAPKDINDFIIALPPVEEQELIISFINDKVDSIESSVTLIENSIKKLKLYRQSIISEVVTGKVDVRDWEKPK